MLYGTAHPNYNLSRFQIKTNVSLSEITFSVILIFALMFLINAITLLQINSKNLNSLFYEI